MDKVNLLGQGGICKIVIDILSSNIDYEIVSIFDDSAIKINTFFSGFITEGTIKEYVEHPIKDNKYFNCIGNINAIRNRIIYSQILKEKNQLSINVVHKNSVISDKVKLGLGNMIGAGVVIETDVSVGDDNIIFSNSTICHDSKIGNLCYLSPSVTLCGKVELEDNVYIGPGAIITAGVKISRNSIVGAGAVVLKNIPENSVYVGNPAKFLKNNQLWGDL